MPSSNIHPCLDQCLPPNHLSSSDLMLSALDADGQPTQSADLIRAALTDDELITLYRRISFTQAFDQKAIKLQRQGRLGTFPAATGQEAVAAAYGLAMQDQDVLCPYYRDQAALLYRNMPPEALLAYWAGDERGNAATTHPQDLPICVPIASQCAHAVGAAYALKFTNTSQAVLVSLGDGATSKGDYYESVNMAVIHELPIVFFVNNNQWAISVPLEQQSGELNLAKKAAAMGINAIRVDGNDPIAVFLMAQSALERAREFAGPTMIEAITYRLSDHTTVDNAQRYHDPEVHDQAQSHAPHLRLRRFLQNQNLIHDDHINLWTEQDAKRIEQAISMLNAQTPQSTQSMFEYLYAPVNEAMPADG